MYVIHTSIHLHTLSVYTTRNRASRAILPLPYVTPPHLADGGRPACGAVLAPRLRGLAAQHRKHASRAPRAGDAALCFVPARGGAARRAGRPCDLCKGARTHPQGLRIDGYDL
eukprot:354537-Chlamydomonas_euryale.AAC.2